MARERAVSHEDVRIFVYSKLRVLHDNGTAYASQSAQHALAPEWLLLAAFGRFLPVVTTACTGQVECKLLVSLNAIDWSVVV